MTIMKGSTALLPDGDREETQEWLESLDAVLLSNGPKRCTEILHKLYEHARLSGVNVSALLNTPYCNTVARAVEPKYPGDLKLERKITAIVRWNALAMVVRANRQYGELGGHLSSFASGADLFEVGFNHFFRGDGMDQTSERRADLVFFQPHSAPGIYARAFLEGNILSSCQTFGSFPPGLWGLALLLQCSWLDSCVIWKIVAWRTRQTERSGLSSATVKWTSPNR
jgi:pyruvate dehydrogenase E1 component